MPVALAPLAVVNSALGVLCSLSACADPSASGAKQQLLAHGAVPAIARLLHQLVLGERNLTHALRRNVKLYEPPQLQQALLRSGGARCCRQQACGSRHVWQGTPGTTRRTRAQEKPYGSHRLATRIQRTQRLETEDTTP